DPTAAQRPEDPTAAQRPEDPTAAERPEDPALARGMSDLTPSDPEDRKILTLARSARARTEARQGACVRDTDGRTYAAASVDLPHLNLSAVQVAVAMAVSSGAPGLEAVALVGGDRPSAEDLGAVADLPGSGVVVWVADEQGRVTGMVEVGG
ncbi:MAG: hypothetical protein ACLGIF_08940, partial [Actinomycetes bacterium]